MKQIFLLTIIIFYMGINSLAQITSGQSEPKRITFRQQQSAPIKEIPDLIIKEEKFKDENSNNIINANELCQISFKVENIGKGLASNVSVSVSLKGEKAPGVQFDQLLTVWDIPGDSQ